MSRFLVLDWDHNQLNVVLATVQRGAVKVLKALSLAEAQSPNPGEAEAQGKLLNERLKAAGIAPAPVLACVGRDRVILKDLRHPPVPAHEEPAIIRFQVVKELTDPPDEVVIDYTHAGAVEGSADRRSLALIVRRELLAAYQNICKAAGLKLVGLCPRPFGTLACLKHLLGNGSPPGGQTAPEGAIGVLTVGKPWAEFCILHGDNLLFSRSLTVGPMLAVEVRRNLAVHGAQPNHPPVRAVYVAGGDDPATLCERLQQMAGIPVYSFDPFAGADRSEVPVESLGAFVGAVGLLYAQADGRGLPINFTKPKQPRPPRDPNRRQLVLAAAAAAALLVAVVGYCYSQLENRDQQLAALFEEKTDLEQQLARLDEDNKRIKALDDWTKGEVVVLDELYDLTDRFPNPNGFRLTQLTFEPLTRTAKSPYVSRMTLKGIMTNDYKDVNKLESQLVNDGRYRVEPKVVTRNSAGDRFRFPLQFLTRAEVEKLPPEKFVRVLPDKPALSEPDFGRGPGDFGGFGFDGGQP